MISYIVLHVYNKSCGASMIEVFDSRFRFLEWSSLLNELSISQVPFAMFASFANFYIQGTISPAVCILARHISISIYSVQYIDEGETRAVEGHTVGGREYS